MSSFEGVQPQTFRPLASYCTPSIWGDQFTSFSFDNKVYEVYAAEVERLKEEVKHMLVNDDEDIEPTQKMKLIHTLERLGVSYHFEKEIENELERLFPLLSDVEVYRNYDLYTIALHFLVFRQHGYRMSCDVFNKFKDGNGNFKNTISSDTQGMLSLYEAAHLRMRGEDILEEALTFTTTQLESLATHVSPLVSRQIMDALERPFHREVPKVMFKRHVKTYQDDPSKSEFLERFAKVDFNMLQLMHKEELCHISRWWREMDFTSSKLSYARKREVECYFWALTAYFEPQYSAGRIILAKTFCITSVIDDTYDSYGTLEELKLFTDAVQRWDISAIDQLPDYMKIVYGALLDVTQEFDKELSKQGRSFCVHHFKQAIKEITRCYYTEAKWMNERYVASFEEYMSNALITAGCYLLAVASFMGMLELGTIEAFEWLESKPRIVKASCTIGRLMDDIIDHEEEQERAHVATGIKCYMKQYGVLKEEAVDELNRRIENAWMEINEEFLEPNSASIHLLMRILNIARSMNLIFKDQDGYTNSEAVLKEHIVSLFVDPIPT